MKRRELARWEAWATREAEWFFGTQGGKVTEDGSGKRRQRAEVIERALRAIPPFHRGALSLWHDRKKWPLDLQREFGMATSLAVRLECALHPSVGSTETLEAAAVVRISALITRGRDSDQRLLARLANRADRHHRLAIRALAKSRSAIAARREEAPVSGVVLVAGTSAKELA